MYEDRKNNLNERIGVRVYFFYNFKLDTLMDYLMNTIGGLPSYNIDPSKMSTIVFLSNLAKSVLYLHQQNIIIRNLSLKSFYLTEQQSAGQSGNNIRKEIGIANFKPLLNDLREAIEE